MENKVKIRISETAYNKLLDLLANQSDYSIIRFSYNNGCCKSSKIEISLDVFKTNDIQDNIEELPIVYDHTVLENIKEITIIHKNSSFMVKSEPRIKNKKSCSSCSSSCHKGCNNSN